MIDLKVVPIETETDVLVIGGGLAGCMAAIHAAERGDLKITLVDKSNTIASGCAASGIDHLWGYITWSIKNEGKGTQFMRYFEGEEGLTNSTRQT